MTLVEETLSRGKSAWHRRRPRAEISRPLILAGSVILVMVIAGGIFAPLLSGWGPEEIDFAADINDYNKLNADEKLFVENVLAFFAGSDGIIFENINCFMFFK